MEDDLILKDVLKALKRYWLLIAIATIATILIAIIITIASEPKYKASAKLLVNLSFSGRDFLRSQQPLEDLNNGMMINERLTKTYSELIDIDLVKRAAKETGLDLSEEEVDELLEKSISVKPLVSGAQLIEVTVEYKGAGRTAALANNISRLLADKATRLRLISFPGAKTQPALSLVVASKASVPLKPAKPRPVINLIVGLILGLFPSAALALLLDHFNKSVKDIEEVRRLIGNTPILAQIPHRREPVDALGQADRADVAQSLIALRTRLNYLAPAIGAKTILISGLTLEDGKTAVLGKLGASLAKTGKRTLLIDADLRRATLTRAFDIAAPDGLGNVLEGSCGLEDAIISFGAENLSILPAGRSTFEPGDLLATEKMAAVLAEVRRAYDYVLVDAPTADAAVDSSIIGGYVDGVILVVRLKRTEVRAIEKALISLAQSSARLLGVVLYEAAPEFSDDNSSLGPESKTEAAAGAAI